MEHDLFVCKGSPVPECFNRFVILRTGMVGG